MNSLYADMNLHLPGQIALHQTFDTDIPDYKISNV